MHGETVEKKKKMFDIAAFTWFCCKSLMKLNFSLL